MTCSYLICHALFCCHYELFKFHINQFLMFTKQMVLYKKKRESIIMTFSSQKYSNSYTFCQIWKLYNLFKKMYPKQNYSKVINSKSLRSRVWNHHISERMLLNFRNVCQLRYIRNLFAGVLSIPFLCTKHYQQIVAVIAKWCR